MEFCNRYIDLPSEIKNKINEANLFFSEEYEQNTILRGQRLYYVWTEEAILVARVKKQLFLKAAVLESEPYVFNENIDQKKFLDESMLMLKKHGVQWTVCATTARFQDYPSNCKVVPCGNFIIDLTDSEEELWKNVHSKHRNSIRRGEKAGIELIIGREELVSEYVPISNETYGRSGKYGGSVSYYQGLLNGLENNIVIILAYIDGQVHAGGMFYFNQAMAYYLHGASIGRPEPGATNYLLWRAILHFKEMGIKQFSFVGYRYDPEENSKLDGIQRFKERFGGTLEKSFNFRCEQNPIAYRVFCFAMQLKNHKPFIKYEDAIDEQIDKYPELNGGHE